MTDFAATKRQFHLPAGMIYLDGNSLGPLPRATAARVAKTVEQEWGDMLITGWNKAGWMDKPMRVGDRIARLIGAEEGHVVMGDTLSIKVYQALASCLEMNPTRKVILSDTGNFPSDLYMAEGLCRTLGAGYTLKTVAPEEVYDAIDETVAVTMITEVDYRTGRKHDMATLTARAHEKGALAIWDLAHSAGALPVHLAKVGADFAVLAPVLWLSAGGDTAISSWLPLSTRAPAATSVVAFSGVRGSTVVRARRNWITPATARPMRWWLRCIG